MGGQDAMEVERELLGAIEALTSVKYTVDVTRETRAFGARQFRERGFGTTRTSGHRFARDRSRGPSPAGEMPPN